MIALLAILTDGALAQTPGPCRSALRTGARPAYTDTLTSAIFPLKVHYNRPEDATRAQLVLDYAELSWQVQVEELGFRAPQLPDDEDGPELDFYLSNVGAGLAYAQAISWDDQVVGDAYNSAAAFMVVDQELPEAWVPSYISHEFNHVLQWGIDFTEMTLPLWEGVAVAAQDWTLGYDAGNWALDVDSFQEAPWLPALVGDSYEAWYRWNVGAYFEYGSALWMMHLDEVVGDGDGSYGPLLWEHTAQEGLPNEPDVVDAFAETAGVELGQALNDLARTRWLIGAEWDARGLAEAQNWDATRGVPFESRDASDLPLTDFVFSPSPMVTGQAYIEVGGLNTADTLVATANSSTLHSGVLVLWWGTDGSVGEEQAHGVDPSVELPLASIERVVIALTNLGPEDWDGEQDPYVQGDQTLQLALVQTTEPTTDTGAPDSTTAPSRPHSDPPNQRRTSGCGCNVHSPTTVPFWLFGIFAVTRRRD